MGIDDINLLYNLSVCREIDGDFEGALALLGEAKQRMLRPEREFIEAEKRLEAQRAAAQLQVE